MLKTTRLSPRQHRVLAQLINGSWISRETVDAIAGVSNGPAVVSELRGKGLQIDMQRVYLLDRDGKPCMPGRYRLEPVSKTLARKMLEAH